MALCKSMVQKEYNRKLFGKVGVFLLYFVLHSNSKEDSLSCGLFTGIAVSKTEYMLAAAYSAQYRSGVLNLNHMWTK
jgi:hypothetical protein